MLVIFDLDDTLIDTSGSIVPLRLKYALEKMILSGLILENPEEQLKKLFQMNSEAVSAKQALEKFLIFHGVKEKFFDIAVSAVYDEFDPSIKVRPRKGANKILNILKKNHQLALVSVGKEAFQMQKLKNAGIDFSLFSIIEIVQNENKKPAYNKIIEELNQKAENTLVCGDKVAVDLLPAKELSCITVHMLYGRGKNFESVRKDLIDYEIQELEELKPILKKIGCYDYK